MAKQPKADDVIAFDVDTVLPSPVIGRIIGPRQAIVMTSVAESEGTMTITIGTKNDGDS